MVEEKDSKLESEGEQPKDERQFDQEQYDRHGLTRANTDEHGRTRTVVELVNKEYRWEFSPPSRSGLGGRLLG